MSKIMLCGRPGACCVEAKILANGSIELVDEKDGRNIVLTEDERTKLRELFIDGVL